MNTRNTKNKLPSSLALTWERNKEKLPTKYKLMPVQCVDKTTKEKWFTYAEFVPHPNRSFDQWRILGAAFNSCFARGSRDDWFAVTAWATVEKKK